MYIKKKPLFFMLLSASLFGAGCLSICGDSGLSRQAGAIFNLALLSVVIFGVGFLAFFGFCLYKIVQQMTSSSEKQPTETNNTKLGHPASELICSLQAGSANDSYRFVDKIPEYKLMLERWMETEKPYMNKDFKLLDVMQALPLNRSYLSRMFNEAYGETFFSVVMRYRIEESVRMLESRPDLTVTRIADICGFSSASVFGRAFLKNRGVTPKEYRKGRSSVA